MPNVNRTIMVAPSTIPRSATILKFCFTFIFITIFQLKSIFNELAFNIKFVILMSIEIKEVYTIGEYENRSRL
ncbi:MAG: hypothetical protein ACW97W_13130, partial [Candidatus Hodarchaeales archaeon]